jgi:hypothetical protein
MWNGASTGYIRQVISQIVADIRIVNICEGESYFFNGEYLTEEGVYAQISTDSSACSTGADLGDAIRLVVRTPQYLEIYDTVCDGKAYIWEGDAYTETGVYSKVLTNKYGCDSVVTLNLTISAPYEVEITDTICAGDTYTWDGRQYSKTGVYRHKYSSIEGCDSVVILNLLVGEVYDIEFADTICHGDSYVWNGTSYTESGSYTQIFTSQYGCDSVVTLKLTVLEKSDVKTTDALELALPSAFKVYTMDHADWVAQSVVLHWQGASPLHIFVAKEEVHNLTPYNRHVLHYEMIPAGEEWILTKEQMAAWEAEAAAAGGKLYVRFLTEHEGELTTVPVK